jgi:hypothetical protein
MRATIVAAALIGLIAVPINAIAQQRSSDLELRQPRRPTVVHPPISKEQEIAAQDAEQARDEIAAKAQRYQILRDSATGPRQRPDLGYDVTGGIQSQRINNSLKK